MYQSPLRQAVSSSSDAAAAVAAPPAWSRVSSSTSIWVALRCGCSEPITRIRPRSPACSRLARSSVEHAGSVSGDARTAGAARQEAPPVRGRCRPGASRSPVPRCVRSVPAGPASGVPVTTTTPVRPPSVSVPPPRWARSDPAPTRRSASSGQDTVVHVRPRRFSASASPAASGSAGSDVLSSSQDPALGLGDVGQVALLPFDGQQSLVEQPIGVVAAPSHPRRAAAPRRSAAPCRTGRARRGRPRTRRPGMPSPGSGSSGRCGSGGSTAAGARRRAAADRPRLPPGRRDGRRPTGSTHRAAPGGVKYAACCERMRPGSATSASTVVTSPSAACTAASPEKAGPY